MNVAVQAGLVVDVSHVQNRARLARSQTVVPSSSTTT
jgi:hypothetical protein